MFVNFAHRGASEYAPENTMLAFNLGVYMQANGIETDVQLTKESFACRAEGCFVGSPYKQRNAQFFFQTLDTLGNAGRGTI